MQLHESRAALQQDLSEEVSDSNEGGVAGAKDDADARLRRDKTASDMARKGLLRDPLLHHDLRAESLERDTVEAPPGWGHWYA